MARTGLNRIMPAFVSSPKIPYGGWATWEHRSGPFQSIEINGITQKRFLCPSHAHDHHLGRADHRQCRSTRAVDGYFQIGRRLPPSSPKRLRLCLAIA